MKSFALLLTPLLAAWTFAPISAAPVDRRAVSVDVGAELQKRASTTTSQTSVPAATTTTVAPSVHTGQATYFFQDNQAGACGNYNPDSVPLVALQAGLYGDMNAVSKYCGRYVTITNTANNKNVVAIVADACPGCATHYSLDLSTGAFDQIGDRDTGVLPISWYFLPLGYKPPVSITTTTKTTTATTIKTTTQASTTSALSATIRTASVPSPTSKASSTSKSSTTTKTTTTTSTTTTSAKPSPTSNYVDARIRSNNITGFNARTLGNNSNAIISWFHTNSTTDSTNGHSWCGFTYNDKTPGFAISLKTMLDNFGGDYPTAARAYCGLEAVVTNSAGYSRKLIVADAFDDHWVRTPNSIDMVYGTFTRFLGATTRDKNVVQYGSWKFTGRRDLRYQFNGVGAGL